MSTETIEDANLMAALTEPFDADEIKWKPQIVKSNRAMAIAYVDARVVEERLDDVFGVGGWQDSYTLLPNGSVMCQLRAKIGSEWIEKSDVGSQSEQPDEGDRVKSAFSDALKRAAVKFGIGRYLYRLPSQWVDYDPNKRCMTRTPELPAWATPKTTGEKPKSTKQVSPATNGHSAANPLVAQLSQAATKGQSALKEAWEALTKEQRKEIGQKQLAIIKGQAEEAEAQLPRNKAFQSIKVQIHDDMTVPDLNRVWQEWKKFPTASKEDRDLKLQAECLIGDHAKRFGVKFDDGTGTFLQG